jgi:hypothetical protein
MAGLLLAQAVIEMLQYLFYQARTFLPPDKQLVESVRAMDAETAHLVEAFVVSASLDQRLGLAGQIVDRTIAVHGFFDWESTPEPVT